MRWLFGALVLFCSIGISASASAQPSFVVENVRMTGGDNLPSSEETVTMQVVLHNTGSGAGRVRAELVLLSGDEFIEALTVPRSHFGRIGENESGDNASNPFVFITRFYESEAPVRFELRITAAGGFSQSVPLPEAQTTLGIRGGFPFGPFFFGAPSSFDGDTQVSYRVMQLGRPFLVFVTNLNSYEEFRLSEVDSDQIAACISGQTVVWGDDRFREPFRHDLMMADLSSGTEVRLTPPEAIPDRPRVDGRRVVWQDRRSGRRQVFVFDLDTGSERQLTFDPVDHWYPKISGDRIIWWDNHTGADEVFVYDLSSDTQVQISDGGGSAPDIHGDRAVYVTGLNSFVVYDFTTGRRTSVTTQELAGGSPVIGTDFVVFPAEPFEGARVHIFSYEIATGTLRPIATHPSGQTDPQVSGNRTTWVDFRLGSPRYFLSNLVPSSP